MVTVCLKLSRHEAGVTSSVFERKCIKNDQRKNPRRSNKMYMSADGLGVERRWLKHGAVGGVIPPPVHGAAAARWLAVAEDGVLEPDACV